MPSEVQLYIPRAMNIEIFGHFALTTLCDLGGCPETNDLGENNTHCDIAGSTVQTIHLGDGLKRATVLWYVTNGDHPLILGSQFQFATTCYKQHDEMGATCFHSHRVQKYCEYGLPI